MNLTASRLLVSLFVLGLGASAHAQSVELSTDRPGLDYTSFDLPSADYRHCEAACANDGRCKAWTYVQPGAQGPSARCWLKHSIPGAVGSDHCISGVKRTFRSRWDKVGGAGGSWTTGWVPNHPRQVCGHYAAGCACGNSNYCGEHGSGALVSYWPQGCGGPEWVLQCTSEPE